MTVELVQDRRAQVVEMTRLGLSASQISVRVGITERSVQRHRAAAGIAKRQWADRLTPAELARADELLSDGCSFAEVGRTLGRDTRTIRHNFPGRGWTKEQTFEFLTAVRVSNASQKWLVS